MSIEEIGCCGAYCRTCPEFRKSRCRGCKLGYVIGERDIKKARCKIKVCCIEKGFNSCADCPELESCTTIQAFLNHKGYKYRKYKEAIDFIVANGYDKFLAIADNWKNQYGKY